MYQRHTTINNVISNTKKMFFSFYLLECFSKLLVLWKTILNWKTEHLQVKPTNNELDAGLEIAN